MGEHLFKKEIWLLFHLKIISFHYLKLCHLKIISFCLPKPKDEKHAFSNKLVDEKNMNTESLQKHFKFQIPRLTLRSYTA